MKRALRLCPHRCGRRAQAVQVSFVDPDQPSFAFQSKPDNRPLMPEPLPVRLVAVNDCRLPAPAGRKRELDAFYVGLLGFERDTSDPGVAYHAENFRLVVDVHEPPVARDDLRPLGIEVRSLAEAEQKLIAAEIEYARQRGITPGQESLLLMDPAGNWIELGEPRLIA